MSTPIEVYERAKARGLQFRLLGGGRVEIDGPSHVLAGMRDELHLHGKWLVALAEEFDNPAAAAEQLIAASRKR